MSYRSSDDTPFGAYIVIFVIILLLMGGCALLKQSNSEVVKDVTVDSKERVCDSSRSCKYLVFTDNGTFEITDSMLNGRFNSSDVYGALDEGETYDFKVIGWRIPLFSSYQNIIEVTPSDETPEYTPAAEIPRTTVAR